MKINLKYIVFGFLLFFVKLQGQDLKQQLLSLEGVVSVESILTDSVFASQYMVIFEQSLDHEHPEKGTFNQRVIVSHVDYEKPVVAALEGYRIWNGRAEELTYMLEANQINIEHRFFAKSRPNSIPWELLTIWQAATDQHIIIEQLKKLYPVNWLTTGISKGGQTTMYHRRFYPSDVQASVAYVAPLNFAREDERIYQFLNNVGTDQQRKLIFEFQQRCFENIEKLIPLLQVKAKEKNWSFEFGFRKALEYTILEYSFAFWQWGNYSTDQIPGSDATPEHLLEHLNNVAGFDFFEDKSVEDNLPFFYGALTEMGIYGYKTAPFKNFLTDTTDCYTFDFTAPIGTQPVYNAIPMQQVKQFLDNDATNMLFIVGGLDTWGATGYVPSGRNNLVRMTLLDGHHGTRIRNFSKKDREYIIQLLEQWMQVDINDFSQ